MKIADVIIKKLNALAEKQDVLLERVYAIESRLNDNFLSEEYEEPLVSKALASKPASSPSTNTVSQQLLTFPVGKRGSYETHAPPTLARTLLNDNELAEGTRGSYEYYLKSILEEPENFIKVLQMRNTGTLAKDIMPEMPEGTKFARFSMISNSITVSRRYELMELEDGKYKTTDKFFRMTGLRA